LPNSGNRNNISTTRFRNASTSWKKYERDMSNRWMLDCGGSRRRKKRLNEARLLLLDLQF
jgi:hypothetical protein